MTSADEMKNVNAIKWYNNDAPAVSSVTHAPQVLSTFLIGKLKLYHPS